MLRMHFFGQPRIYQDDKYLDKFPTRKAQLLLYYLVLHRQQCHSRNVLTGLFWTDSPEEHARQRLRTTLWRLRSLLNEPDPAQASLLIENDDICFNTESSYWLDVQEFEANLSHSNRIDATGKSSNHLGEQAARALIAAAELYRGDLLEGCYEDWCLFERERLQGLYLDALVKLMDYHHQQGAYSEAIRYGLRVLSHDPLIEQVHREVMRLHCLAGNRAAALRQYQQCAAILLKELGVEPMEETTTLYNQIRQNGKIVFLATESSVVRPILSNNTRGHAIGSTALSPAASHMDAALHELLSAQADLAHLSAQFQKAVQALENIRQDL